MQRRRHALLSITLVVMVLLEIAGANHLARAVASGCRTDPIFYFSNGDKLSLTMAIGVVPQDVIRIEYVVHAPAGTSLERVVSTGPVETTEATTPMTGTFKVFLPMVMHMDQRVSPRSVETFDVQFDQPEGTYTAAARAYTVKDPVPVTLYMSLRANRQSTDGESAQWLSLEVLR